MGLLVYNDGYGTTTAIDTTGVTCLIGFAADGVGSGFSDNYSNTYGTVVQTFNGGNWGTMLICESPAVGPGHTFSSLQPFAYVALLGYDNFIASPIDQTNAFADTNTQIQAGPITPTQANTVILACSANGDNAFGFSVDSGFTALLGRVAATGIAYGGTVNVLNQGAASTVDPIISWTGVSAAEGLIANFKTAGATTATWPGYQSPFGWS